MIRKGFALIVALSPMVVMADVGDELLRLVPDSPVSNQDFGDAVDIAGNLVLVGAEDTPSGNIPSAGKVFLFDATTGAQLQEFVTDDPPATRAFGSAVATDGVHYLVSAEDDNNVTGVAYLFDDTGTQLHRLTASDGGPGHEFGQAIGVSGDIVAVAAPGVNTFRGQVYLYDVETGLELGTPIAPTSVPLAPGDEFGNSMAIDGDRLIAGMENGGLGGPAFIFDTDGNELHVLQPPIDPATNEPVRGFGRQVAISGNRALVGATPDENQVFPGEFGRAFVFDVTTGQQLFELVPDDSLGEDLFGEDLDIDGNMALIGARREAALGLINQAYLFDVTTGQQVTKLNLGGDIVAQDEALEGIAIGGRFAVGGVESYDSPGFSNNGIAIVFDAGGLACDFDGDGVCDGVDIDSLIAAIAGSSGDTSFDLNGDGVIDLQDRDEWLSIAGDASVGYAYQIGDANLDGFVDISDLNIWNTNKFTSTPAWTQGDLNADGIVDVSDLNLWNSNKFQTPTVAVPEPSPPVMVSCLLLAVLSRRFGSFRLTHD